MAYKPFRTPFVRKPVELQQNHAREDENQPPPAKKRRISDAQSGKDPTTAQIEPSPSQWVTKRPNTLAQPRKPLHAIIRPPSSQATPTCAAGNTPELYYNVLYRKVTAKKHKTWEGDGILSVRDGYATLQDESGRQMGRNTCSTPLLPGSMLSIGGKDIEVESLMSKENYVSGRAFLNVSKSAVQQLEEKPRINIKFNSKQKESDDGRPEVMIRSAAPSSQATSKQFKSPFLNNTVMPVKNTTVPVPRHDPSLRGAIVLKRPSQKPKGTQIVDVVVDPIIAKNLREHQIEGVKFMYECVMGMRPDSGEGAILADEMGLGKSLQVIALLWTLLKQNPIYEAKPVLKKAIIVCPATLVKNWHVEFRKWLGNERIGVLEYDEKAKLTDFTKGKSYSVMIIGYERLRTVQDELQKVSDIGIVIMDEGHRLKSAKNKSTEAIKKIPTEKRIILSGTPLQNDLGELYFVVDLVNPGLLGKYTLFKREFETPIVKSRQPGASTKDVEKGEARNKELMQLTRPFILRRTADILLAYLPSKTEHVLFCRPTETQAAVYRQVLESPDFSAILHSNEASFQLQHIMKKLCNSPSLLKSKDDSDVTVTGTVASLVANIPQSLLKSPGASGKLQVLDGLLHRLRTTTEEKVVIVSHYTSTLDVLGNLVTSLGYPWLRLDGSTPSGKRQGIVDKFNRTNASTCFAFLLSAKSGGVGLNLVGASRLVLYDIDWNPSIEIQAMARIHRDGQKRPCKIYRLVTQGAVEEKIYQRQLTKMGLADSIVDQKTNLADFSKEDLRDVFALDESGICQTHELLNCDCKGCGMMSFTRAPSPVPALLEIPNIDSDDDVLPSLSQLCQSSPPRVANSQAKQTREEVVQPAGISLPQPQWGASQAQVDTQEAEIREQTRDRLSMSALMQYRHIDVAKLGGRVGASDAEADTTQIPHEDAEMMLDDDVLLHVMRDTETRVSFVFTKTSSL